MKHVIESFCIDGCGGAISLIDERPGKSDHWDWKSQMAHGLIPPLPLPAEFVRVTQRGSKPSVFFDECSQRHPAAASKFTACERSASAQAHIKQWAFVAGLQPSEPERAMRSEFWDYRKDLFQKVQALTPAQLAQFFNQDRAPLPVTFQAEAKRLEIYLHDWSI